MTANESSVRDYTGTSSDQPTNRRRTFDDRPPTAEENTDADDRKLRRVLAEFYR